MPASVVDLRAERQRRALPAPTRLWFGRSPEWFARELIALAAVAACVGLLLKWIA